MDIRKQQKQAILKMLALGDEDEDGPVDWKVLILDEPCRELLAPLVSVNELRGKGVTLHAALESSISSRLPLRIQHSAAVPLRQFNPAFEDDFQPRKNMDPDRERAELASLKRLHKREKKGAVRELRKDALFIARQRQAEEDKTSDYLEARGKRSMSIMQDQEANWKSMKREKSGRGVKPKKEPGASI